MADTSNTNQYKYLDYAGLKTFANLVNQKVTDSITSLSESIANTYLKKTDSPNKTLTVMYTDDKNQIRTETYNGTKTATMDLRGGLYYATTSTTATRVSNTLNFLGASDVAIDQLSSNPAESYNGARVTNLDFSKLARKATTLTGYGITNAYTKTEVDDKLATKLNLAGGTLTGATNITATASAVYPTNQILCLNATSSTDDIVAMPGIGFHIPNKGYATLKYTKKFEFMNSSLTGHEQVKASKFITAGGTSTEVVCGDGALAPRVGTEIANTFTKDQLVSYSGRSTIIKNGGLGFLDPNTSSWAMSMSQYDTTGATALTNIFGVKGGNNKVEYLYAGGSWDRAWLRIFPKGQLGTPFFNNDGEMNLTVNYVRSLCSHVGTLGDAYHNSLVIKTGIPISYGRPYYLHVYGYNYGNGGNIDFTIGFYMYQGSPLNIYGSDMGTQANPRYYIGKYTDPTDNVEKVCVYWTADSPINNAQQHFIMVDGLFYGGITSTSEYTAEILSDEVKATLTQIAEASLNRSASLNKKQSFNGEATFNNSVTFNSSAIFKNITIPGLESNNDYIENKSYDNGLWGTESGKSPEMTHALASIKNAIKFNWYNDDWIIGNIRAGSASSDGFGIGMEKTKSDGTIYQKNIFRLSPDGEIYLNGTPLANKYLSLSGGTMTGNLVTKQINVEAGNWVITNGQGIMLQRSDGPSYIWNKTTNYGILIGTNAIGDTSEANASLIIKGSNIYPGTSNKFSLGTDSYKFKDILADGRVVGGRFSSGGAKSKAVLESDTNTGLSIVPQIPLNGSTAGDYGFPANNNANGVLAFRMHPGSGFNYMHYLGFSNDGEIYHMAQNAPFAGWRNLTNPFGSIRMPRTIDGAHSQAVIPSMLNEGIVNIFNYPLKTELLIERSQDGNTWVDVTEDEYENFRCGFTKGYNQGGNRYVAYDKTSGKVGDRLRITYTPNNRYCSMGYLDVYYTTSGATTTFTFELNNKNDESTWVKVHDSKPCTGWPGHNYYGLSGYNFGQTNGSNYYACRMTFEITAISSSSNNLGAINYIYGFTAQTPYSTRSDSYFRYDVTLQACRNTGHIIPSSTGYELGNQQFPFKTVITQNLAISLGSGHTPNYITSDTNRNMFIKVADVVPFVVDCADTNNPVVRSGSSMAGKVNLGASTNKWKNVYANNFYGNFYGRLYTPDGTSNHFVKGDGSISTRINVTHDATSASPLNQAICVNAATGTDDIAKMPGIGFHNPGKSYATLKYTGTFEFMNETLTSYKNVKAAKFIGDLQGKADSATNDSSGNKIIDTYALASTCYGGPEGKFALGSPDNLIGKALTGSWGVYNKYHDIVISEYDASTETWVEKFNSTTLTGSSKDYFEKGLTSSFYTSTRGSRVKMTVTSNAGAQYVQVLGLYLKTKDATYNGNIDYSYWTNDGKTSYSGVSGTWGTWSNITMSGAYRTSFEIYFNEGGANAQITINGFRIVTQADGIDPIVVGKSHESYRADAIKGYFNPFNADNDTAAKWIELGTVAAACNTNTLSTAPSAYGVLFSGVAKTGGGGEIGQIWVGQVGAPVYRRAGNTNGWWVGGSTNSPWIEMIDTLNLSNHVVPKTGGTFTGNVTFNGDLNVAAGKSIYLNRTDWNYICVPTGDYSGVAISQGGTGGDYTWYVMNKDAIYPNTGTRDLGKTNKKWNNVYANIIRPNSIQFTDDEFDGYIGMEQEGLRIEADNTISLNSTSVECTGVVNSDGGFFDLSDARFKDFHSDVNVDFDKISKLPKKYFTWKDDGDKKSHIGTSAQAVQELYPELVNESNGKLSVDYAKLSVIALAAIDKLNERIEYLESKLK